MMIDRRISVAPMMDYTDRHCRYLLRLVSPGALLYTEMVTAQALAHGDVERLLGFDPAEHPVALQLGGSDPALLAQRRAAGRGARLRRDQPERRLPERPGAERALRRVPDGRAASWSRTACARCARRCSLPVTVKCRIGIDELDDYGFFECFVATVREAGVDTFIVHARKAYLQGLSPKENREIPPLRYDVPERLKREHPDLTVILNGGLKTVGAGARVAAAVRRRDARAAGLPGAVPARGAAPASSSTRVCVAAAREAIVERYADYVERMLRRGPSVAADAAAHPRPVRRAAGRALLAALPERAGRAAGAGAEVLRASLRVFARAA